MIESQVSALRRLRFPPWLAGRWGIAGIVLILYTLIFLVWTQFHWGGEENISLIGNVAILPPMLFAALIAWRVALQQQLDPRLRRAWLLIGLGTFSDLLGEAAWAYLENGLHVAPFPSIADIFFVGYYPLLLGGILALPSAPQNRRERLTLWFNLLVLMTTASMYVSYFLLIPTASVSDTDFLGKVLAIAYPVCSLILLGGALALLFRLPELNSRAVLRLLFMSIGFFIASDLAFGYTSLIGTYAAGNLTDAGWHIAQVFIVLAALRQLHRAPAVNVTRRPIALDSFVRMLPFMAVLLGYGLVFYIVVVNFHHAAIGMLAAALLLTALVVGQQIVSPVFANLPIRAKVILTFFLVSVLSVSLVSLMSYLTIRSNLQSTVGTNLKSHVTDRAEDLGSLLSRQSELLQSLALSQIIQDQAAIATAEYPVGDVSVVWERLRQRELAWRAAPNGDPLFQDVLDNEAAEELHKFRSHLPGYLDLLLTDKYGAVLAATTLPDVYDQSILSWWQPAFDNGRGRVYLSQPSLDPATESRHLMIVMPVRAEPGSDLVGMLLATYNFTDIMRILANESSGPTGNYNLVLPTGQMLTYSNRFVFMEQATLETLQATAADDFAWMNLQGTTQMVSQASVTSPHAGDADAIDGLHWKLIAYQEQTEAFAPLNAAWMTTLFSTLTVLSVTTGLAVVLAQMLAAPIARLTVVAKQIGAGDLSAKAQVESRDEIGTLASTFNSMLDALSLARQDLQESEYVYRSLVDDSPDTIVVHSQGRVRFINPAGVRLLGVQSADELIGREIEEIIPMQDREQVSRGIAYSQGITESTPLIQQRMHRSDGTSFEAEFRAIPISYAGQPAIQFVMRDITERKRAEEKIHRLLSQVARQRRELEIRVEQRTAELNTANQRLQDELSERQRLMESLHESETRFRMLFAASPDAILLLDPTDPNISWPIVDCNEAACTMNGYAREELIGQTIDVLNATPGDPAERQAYLQFLREEGVLHRDGVHRHKDGHIFPIAVSSSLVSFSGRELVLGIDRDITQRKQAELALQQAKDAAEKSRQEAEAASRAKSEFLSRMSHELRTPMNAILGFAQLLEMSRKEPLTSTQKERVKQIVKGGQHLLDLINEILDISRIEANRLHISPEPVSIRESIQEVLDLTVPLAVKRQIQIVTRMGRIEDNSFVLADRQRLKQVLLNLLGNAVKYNYDGGSVIVSCEQVPPDRWRISITDTGPGISQENRARLFIPFERLGADQPNVEGTGLGLVLAKRLVELMNGQVGVESVRGKGSTFWIELPVAENPVERLQRVGTTGELPVLSAAARTILYVEDNVANFELIRQVLADYTQIELLWAADLKTGMQLASERQLDLILLDVHLSGMDGGEILRQLKWNRKMAEPPVVVISADATPRQIERLMSWGAHSFLTKPLDVKQFVRLIEELLAEKEV
jgi:PAS domain S-box-containing protein